MSLTFNLPPGFRAIPGALTSGGARNQKSCEGRLDQFGLIASQAYNLGNDANWFFSFRMGMSGVSERLQILKIHSDCLHEWQGIQNKIFVNHHVLVMLFCMDSAIECFTFMLNALGQAVDRTAFRDISTTKGLRNIGPRDIIGTTADKPMSGYERLFPSLQAYWLENTELLELIMANHDVSKHRHSPPQSVQARQDPPAGYFEAMGIVGSDFASIIERGKRTPAKVVSLSKKPRLPISDADSKEVTSLEEIERKFGPFLPRSFCLAFEDARQNIKLPNPNLRT